MLSGGPFLGVSDEPDRAGAKPKPTASKTDAGRIADRDVGASLRSVYQKTVDEQIPDEFLDLLGKLK